MKSAAIALLLLALAVTGAQAGPNPPPFPQALYGNVYLVGVPAPVGTVVEARGPGVKVGIPGNPITTTVAGKYGGPTLWELKLGVQGDIAEGAPIDFYVNGVSAQASIDSILWGSGIAFQSGVVSQVHLRTRGRQFAPYFADN